MGEVGACLFCLEGVFPYGYVGAPTDTEEACVGNVEGGGGRRGVVGVHFAEGADVEDVHSGVCACCRHVVSPSVDGYRSHGAAVGEHFH